MKKLLYLLSIVILGFWACESNSRPKESYLVGTWQAGPQTLQFFEDSNAIMIIERPNQPTPDTMQIWYNYAPDSMPMHLDMRVHEATLGTMKGMNLFGVMEIVHPDTFRTTSKMGFEGQGYKYRPKQIEEGKMGTYVRVK
ncbi:MAG: hypothetical protein AAF806_18910 [Bacteroidota bacterium]